MHLTLWNERTVQHLYGVLSVQPVGKTHEKLRIVRDDGTGETVEATAWRVDA